jgi:hypothetical protein
LIVCEYTALRTSSERAQATILAADISGLNTAPWLQNAQAFLAQTIPLEPAFVAFGSFAAELIRFGVPVWPL